MPDAGGPEDFDSLVYKSSAHADFSAMLSNPHRRESGIFLKLKFGKRGEEKKGCEFFPSENKSKNEKNDTGSGSSSDPYKRSRKETRRLKRIFSEVDKFPSYDFSPSQADTNSKGVLDKHEIRRLLRKSLFHTAKVFFLILEFL